MKKTPEKMNDSSSGQGRKKITEKTEKKKENKKYDDDKVLF